MNSIFNPCLASAKIESSHFFTRSRLKRILSYMLSALPMAVIGQVATQIIRTSDSTALVTVLDSGNVGIGMTDPLSKLHVDGTVQALGLKLTTGAINNYVLTSDGGGIASWQPTQLVGIGGSGVINYLSKFSGTTTLGSSGVFEDGSGNIGIATTTPLQKLSIGNGYTNSFHFEIATDNPTLHFGNTYGTYISYGFGGGLGFALNGWSGTGVWGRFLIDGSEIMRLTSSGDLGIGTNNPQSKLHVEGEARMTGFRMGAGAANNYVLTSDGSGAGTWQPTQLVGIGGSGSSGYLSKFDGSTTLNNSVFYQDGDGEIGIGTETPSRSLHIYSSTAGLKIENPGSNSNPSLYVENDVRQWQVFVDGGNSGTDGFAIRDVNAGQDRFIIHTDGDVGIGVVNPDTRLSVNGDVRAGSLRGRTGAKLVLSGYDNGIGSGEGIEYDAVEGGHDFQTHDGGWASRLYISDGGNIGVGTNTPSVKLDVNGSVRAAAFTSSSPLHLQTASVTRIYADDVNGFVGIGTTSPTSLLHVAGNAEMAGLKVTTGATNNYVLTSDGSGNASWQPTQLVGIGGSGSVNYLPKFTASTTLGSSGVVEDGSGRIGIGTGSPLQQLSIGNGYTNSFHFETATDFPTIHFGDSYGVYINYGFGGGLGFALNGSAGTGVWGRFLIDGSEIMRLTAAGDLGIGTNNPQAKLHVEGTTQMTGFKMSTGASNNYVLTSNGTGTGTWQPTQLVGIGGSGSSGYLSKFNGTTTLNSSVFYQDDDGDIGIGTEVPSRPLHIYSSIAAMQITNPTTNSNPSLFLENDQRIWQVFVDGGNSGTDGFMIRDGNAGQDRFLINTSGDVGIGTASPLSKLHVNGAVRASAFTSSSPLLLQTNGTTRIYVDDSNGNVGIGTTTPQQLLVIKGNETSNGEQFQISTASGSHTWGIGVNSSSGGLTIRDETNLVNPISIAAGASTGSLSIGTNSVSLLTAGSGSNIRFSTNASERMRIDHSGNVGIGTTSPAERLDVVGNVQMTGFKLPTGSMNNYVLTSDASGVGTWQEAPGADDNGTMNYISKFIDSNTLGNSVIYEDGSGNVGIGTTTPQQLLVVKGNETASGEQFQISTASGSRTWGIGVNSSSGGFTIRDETGLVNPISISAGAASGSISIGTQSISLLTGGVSSFIKFSTNATERMRIDVNGNTGIGTATPAEKLDVVGNIQMTGFKLPTGATNNYVLTADASGVGTWQEAPGADDNGTMNYISKFIDSNTLGNSGIYEDGSGNVGIGTTTPQQLLVVKGNETASGEQFQISTASGSRVWGIGVNSVSGGFTIRDETGLVNPVSIAAGAVSGSISIGTNSVSLLTGGVGSNIRFSTNALERMRIDHNGNVGIGTTSPSYMLDIAGGLRSGSDMIIGPGTDKTLWFNRNEATYTRAWVRFFFDGSSNNLDLATIDGTSDTETARILLSQNGTMQFRTSNAEVMRIENDGDIAIGTSSADNILTIEQNSSTDPIADAWTTYSSRRWKTNIRTLENALTYVTHLRGVSYQWKADGKQDIGFIAEEVGEIYPEIVAYEENGIDAKSVDYSRLVAVLVEAMKEQQEIIEQQQSELDSYSARLEKLEQLLNER